MNRAVVDASAVLAFAFRESGWQAAEPLLVGSLINAVNAAEVTSRVMARGASLAEARSLMAGLLMDVSPLDSEQALLTGQLHRETRPYGLSLADCACLALARARHLPAVTADRAWRDLPLGVEIVLIR
ncbi:MAG TPA: type II toxin-antitoxin system VapC family toxin [Caulobacteraceae bacterium]